MEENQSQPVQEIAKPNTAIAENQVVTEQQVIKEGKVTFGNLRGQTPVYIKKAVRAIQKTLGAVAGIIAASEVYPPYTSKKIILVLLIGAAVAEGIGSLFGVDTSNDK